MIVVLEGIDASGKQTQTKRLVDHFTALDRFVEVSTFDFPHYQGVGGGLVGRVLRGETIIATDSFVAQSIKAMGEQAGVLLKKGWDRDKALLIQCAMLADRCEFSDLIESFTNRRDKLLILDRYYLSGIVYGQADGLDRAWLERIHRVLPKPDLFFVIDISVEESFRRRPERVDYYEKNRSKLEMVRDLYAAECFLGNARMIEGVRSPEAITNDIVAQIVAHLAG